jgi:signal transduction histidine kinase
MKTAATSLMLLLLGWCSAPAVAQDDQAMQVLEQAVRYLDANDPDSGLFMVDQAMRQVGPDAPDEVRYYLHSFRAEQLYYHGLYDEAMSDALDALRLAEGMGDSLLRASALNLLGLLHENIGDHTAALPYLRDALAWYPIQGEARFSVSLPHHIHGNLGQSLAELGQLDSALHYLERSHQLATAAGVPRGVAIADWAIGKVLLAQGLADSAIIHFQRSMELATAEEQYDVTLENYTELARAYLALDDRGRARSVLEEGMAHEEVHGATPVSRREFHKRSAALYSSLGMYRAALRSSDIRYRMDSLIHRRNKAAIVETVMRLQESNSELEVQRLRSALYEGAFERVRFSRMVLLVGSVLGMLVLLGFYLAYRSRQRGKQRLAELELLRLQQERTIDELRIREQVGRDMHDDLGAGLSALKLRSEMAMRTELEPERRVQLADIAKRSGDLIDSMRRIIWAMNSDQGSLEDLVAYAGSYARKYLAEQGLACDIRSEGPWPPIALSPEQRRNLFLVLKEALHNVVKHAQATRVTVSMAWRQGELHMSIGDDGVGLSDAGTQGNGLSNMRQRMAALGGRFDMQDGAGTILHCTVPLQG